MAKVQPHHSSRTKEKVRDMGEAKVNEMVPMSTLNGPVGASSSKKDYSSVSSSEGGAVAVQPAPSAKKLVNVAENDSDSSDISF